VRQQAAGVVIDRRGTFVTGGFDTQNLQWTPGREALRIARLFPNKPTG
jgi:hypothetical protein